MFSLDYTIINKCSLYSYVYLFYPPIKCNIIISYLYETLGGINEIYEFRTPDVICSEMLNYLTWDAICEHRKLENNFKIDFCLMFCSCSDN